MDSLDVRILATLLRDQAASPLSMNVRQSYAYVAKLVGADEGTVRNRIRRMHETRFIEDWRLFVNPHLTGGGHAIAWFDVPPGVSKGELARELRLLPGVYIIVNTLGSFWFVAFRYESESSRARQVELIRKLARTDRVAAGRVPYPESSVQLRPSDWAILRAVQRDPRRTYTSISREVGLSTRTVKRNLQRMIQEHVVFGFAALNPKALQGSLMAVTIVTCTLDRREEINRRVAEAFGEYLYHALSVVPFGSGEPVTCGFSFIIPNVFKGREILDAVTNMSGVLTARLELFEEIYTIFEPFEEELETYATGLRADAQWARRALMVKKPPKSFIGPARHGPWNRC